MTSSSMKSSAPPPPPSGGAGRIAVVLLVLILLGGAGYYFFAASEPTRARPRALPPPPAEAPSTALVPTPPPPVEPPAKVPQKVGSQARTGGFTGVCNGNPTRAEILGFQRYAREHSAAVRRCYERRLKVNNILQGRMEVQATIGSAGNVLGTRVVSDSVRDREVASCVQDNVRSWRMPAPSGGCVQVSFPFNFQPTAD